MKLECHYLLLLVMSLFNCKYCIVVLCVFQHTCYYFFFDLNSRINFKKIISYSFQIADQYDKVDVIREIVSTEGPTGACISTTL